MANGSHWKNWREQQKPDRNLKLLQIAMEVGLQNYWDLAIAAGISYNGAMSLINYKPFRKDAVERFLKGFSAYCRAQGKELKNDFTAQDLNIIVHIPTAGGRPRKQTRTSITSQLSQSA